MVWQEMEGDGGWKGMEDGRDGGFSGMEERLKGGRAWKGMEWKLLKAARAKQLLRALAD